jgi:hypothetical protein
MAQVFGKNSGYLIKKEVRFELLQLAILIFLFACLSLIVFNFSWYSQNFSVPLGISLLIGVSLILKRFDFFGHKADQFYRGRKGESIVFNELIKLPNEYSIFPDAKTQRTGNIDFIVIGPTGIFTIEVKSHSGYVDFDDRELTLNGFPFKEKNIIMQAKHQVMSLREQLKEKMNREYSITPIIVFSNWRAQVRFGRKPVTENIFVIGKSWLNELIISQPKANFDYQSVIERLKLEAEWREQKPTTT